jgi:hypothetical protein
MKWLLVVLVFGNAPVTTNLLFASLDDCLRAEAQMRESYAVAYNTWRQWAQANPQQSGFPDSEQFNQKRIGLHNQATCIPHNAGN